MALSTPVTFRGNRQDVFVSDHIGIAAKAEARLRSEGLPRRSPDLNVLGYSLWHAINERMREEEKQFPANRKDTKEQHSEVRKVAAKGGLLLECRGPQV